MFVAGSSFWIVPEPVPHLWFVISDPSLDPDCLLIANITTYDRSAAAGPTNDPACVLAAGAHRFITHPTCVAYYHARTVSDQYLASLLSQKKIRLDDVANSALLTAMRECAGNSRYMSTDSYRVLLDQNLV